MTTFLTKSDRKHLLDELELCISEMDYSPSEIKQILGDLNEMPNSLFYTEMVAWMPECMDDLRYYNERLQARQKA